MANRILPTPEQLREILRYDHETGKLFWKRRDVSLFTCNDPRGVEWVASCWNSRCAGKEAFTSACKLGYKSGGIYGRLFKAHRVIWAIVYGQWPSKFIDHIDGNPSNNRIENIREATRSENGMNRPAQANNTSGFKGIHWIKSMERWVARARVNKKSYYFGHFKTKEEAVEAYRSSIREVHKQFARAS